jgi:predicted RNA-binding Zn ribbon-like protein
MVLNRYTVSQATLLFGAMALELWDWLSEPLAMDFANTTRRRGMIEHDYLRDAADLESWSEREVGRVPRVPARAAAGRMDEVRVVRDDVKAVLHATVDGTPLPAQPVSRLNARARALPIVPQLGRHPGELRTVPATRATALDELLARVAAATIELAGSGDPDAVHFCDAPSCGDFFAPDRPNQRWCDTSCGTRARVARHAAHGRDRA